MSKLITTTELGQVAQVSAAPAQTTVDRTFGLPTGLYATTVACYIAFLGVMAGLFLNPGLVIPMVIFVGFVLAFFGVPGFWARMQPAHESKPLSWGQFTNRGVQTATGPLSASQASVQVLILPVLILVWGLAIAVIVAMT